MSVSIFRYVPLSTHAALEVLAAPLIMAGPVLLGLDSAAIAIGFVLGVLLLGLSVSLFGEAARARRGPTRSWTLLALAAVLTGIGIGIVTGDAAAMIFLVGVASHRRR